MILYDSFTYKKEIFAKKMFNIKNDDKIVCVDQASFRCENLSIYDKGDYIEFQLLYNNITTSQGELSLIKDLLIDKNNEIKYNEYPTFNSILFYLDKNDLEFAVEVADISDIDVLNTKNNSIINIDVKKSDVNIKVDNLTSDQLNNIELFFNRKSLYQDEKDFIINNFQQQQITDYRKKDKEEKADKNVENFKDFMAKDTGAIVKFKITEEESKIFSPNTLKIIEGSKNPSDDLNKLIGLENVKNEILKLNAKLDYRIKRESRNIYDEVSENLHMCFYGNPGTGKTTVARIMTGLLYNMGYIKKNKCIEINANEMKGTSVGQTAVKTKIILRNAKNKVLFIDEAYALCDGADGYGKEAVDTIVKEMEDNKHNLVIIFAGYENEMKNFIDMNEGLKSRISRYVYFQNYNTIELSKIFLNMVHSQGLLITTDAMIKTMEIFKQISFQKNFSNGRFVRNYFEEVEEEHAFNIKGSTDNKRIYTLELEDINDGIIDQFIAQNKR